MAMGGPGGARSLNEGTGYYRVYRGSLLNGSEGLAGAGPSYRLDLTSVSLDTEADAAPLTVQMGLMPQTQTLPLGGPPLIAPIDNTTIQNIGATNYATSMTGSLQPWPAFEPGNGGLWAGNLMPQSRGRIVAPNLGAMPTITGSAMNVGPRVSFNSAMTVNGPGSTSLNALRSIGSASAMGPSAVISNATATGVPSLNSNPGASYTVYLDFAGFSFNGTWGNTSNSPGDTPSFDGTTGAFTSAEQATIKQIWARVAEKYSPFSVNVTTVDPAVAAGQAGDDSSRQAYYDQTARLMHTVIGGDGTWDGGGGGVSYVGVTQAPQYDASLNGGAGGGFHTNWIFPANLGPNDPKAISEASAHENGHGLGLSHQSDYSGTTLMTEYSTNNGASGAGSFSPIMGASYSSQRGLWRSGNSFQNSSGPTPQNDPQVILGNSGMTLVNDGIGHTRLTATPLSLNGSNLIPNNDKGIIVPSNSTTPNPIGVSNYTTDFFSFNSTGGTLNVTLFDSAERITPGSPDPGGTLWSTLTLLDANGNPVGTPVTTNASTQSENITRSLSSGLFFLEVSSAGGQTSTFDSSAHYYDMGDFFMSGIVPTPEPTSFLLTGLGSMIVLLRRRR